MWNVLRGAFIALLLPACAMAQSSLQAKQVSVNGTPLSTVLAGLPSTYLGSLSGDCIASPGSTSIICTKTNGVSLGVLATLNVLPFADLTGLPTTRSGYGITDAAKNGSNSDITALTGLTTPVPFSEGGLGSTSQAGAQAALGLNSAAYQPSSAFDGAGAASAAQATAISSSAQKSANLSDLTNPTAARGNLRVAAPAQPYVRVAAAQTLNAGYRYGAITSASSLTLTLPPLAGVSDGQSIVVTDISGQAATNGITVQPNGSDKISGVTANAHLIAGNRGSLEFIADQTDGTWQVAILSFGASN